MKLFSLIFSVLFFGYLNAQAPKDIQKLENIAHQNKMNVIFINFAWEDVLKYSVSRCVRREASPLFHVQRS